MFANIALGVVVIFLGYLTYLSVYVQQISDEERKKNGLGPKGQGR